MNNNNNNAPPQILKILIKLQEASYAKWSHLVEDSSAEDVIVLWKAMGPAQNNTCSPEGLCMTTSRSVISSNSYMVIMREERSRIRNFHVF